MKFINRHGRKLTTRAKSSSPPLVALSKLRYRPGVRRFLFTLVAGLLVLAPARAQEKPLQFTSLNCYFFFGGGESSKKFNQPRLAGDYWKKATNLVSLLPTNAPLVVGLQEIGRGREALHLAQLTAAKYQLRYAPLFVQGKDTYTSEDVGALVCLDLGWGLATQAARDPALDRWLSKHIVFRLTTAATALDICVVHLRRAIGSDGTAKQQQQNEALKIWANQRLKENPRANLVILGDFNETKKPGDKSAALAAILQPAGPLVDTFTLSNLKPKTHTNGKAYDRILVSPTLTNGLAGWKFSTLAVREHPNGKTKTVAAWTDHFPLTATFSAK